MPLTRHLYREDEVEAAMMYCILRGRTVDAVFWGMELLDSGLAEALLRGLRTLWLRGFGLGALRWWEAFTAVAAEEALDPDACVDLIVQLSRIGSGGGRDITSLLLLSMDLATAVPDFVGEGGAATATAAGATGALETFLTRAIWQGRCSTAWLAAAALGWEAAWPVLARAAEQKHGAAGMEVVQMLKSGCDGEGDTSPPWFATIAIGAACLPKGDLARRWLADLPKADLVEVQQARAEWEAATGRRARRARTIPADSLYWVTERGRTVTVYQSIEKDITGNLEKPRGIWYSGYWDDIAETYGGWAAIRLGGDDTARESFYAAEFPDDTPDEWSKAEREKSHGRGVLQPGVEAKEEEYWRRWFGCLRSAVLWETDVQARRPPRRSEEMVRPDPTNWCLDPVKREIEAVKPLPTS